MVLSLLSGHGTGERQLAVLHPEQNDCEETVTSFQGS